MVEGGVPVVPTLPNRVVIFVVVLYFFTDLLCCIRKFTQNCLIHVCSKLHAVRYISPDHSSVVRVSGQFILCLLVALYMIVVV